MKEVSSYSPRSGKPLEDSQWGEWLQEGPWGAGPGWSWWPMTDGQIDDFRMLLEVGLTGRACEGRIEDGSWLLKGLGYWEDGWDTA